jgi:ABC-2 type transport system permease protein
VRRNVRLYGALLRTSVQDALQNRVESSIWFLYEILPPLMMTAVWIAAYQESATIAGFSLAEMLAYTVGVLVLRTVITFHLEYGIDYEIREGRLSNLLIRPLNVWAYWLVDSLGWKTFRNLLTVPVVVVCLLWIGPELAQLSIPPERLPPFALSLLLATAVCFLFKLCLGCTSFWTNDILGVATVQELISAVLGGVLIPLVLLPEWLQFVAKLLPVQAIYSVPLMILLGKGDGASPWYGIALQLGWIVVLWALALVLWRAGLRQYAAVGG